MFSGEKEEIAFYQPVDPRDKGVEFWMGDLENMMFATIKNVLDVSVKKYLEGKRTKWMLEHPGQCVLNGSQVHWTNEVETAITKNNLKGYLTFLETQLLDTVELVRKKLTKL
jgi:dynein heavy chain